MITRIFFRVDGNSNIGLGHVMRSLALANMLRSQFSIIFFLRESNEIVRKIVNGNGFEATTIASENDFLSMLSEHEIVVLDGYTFDSGYQKKIKDAGSLLVCIDDLHDRHFFADVVINHAPGVTKYLYDAEPYTQFLLGTEYALLRSAFLDASKHVKQSAGKNIMICFGGADPKNLTLRALKVVLGHAFNGAITVIVGAAYPFTSDLQKTIGDHPGHNVNLMHAVDDKTIVNVLLESCLAIVPASSILFEVIACNTPVISGFYTDNQVDIYQGFKALSAFYDAQDFTDDRLKEVLAQALLADHTELLANQRNCIDGNSDSRYLQAFKILAGHNPLMDNQ